MTDEQTTDAILEMAEAGETDTARGMLLEALRGAWAEGWTCGKREVVDRAKCMLLGTVNSLRVMAESAEKGAEPNG